MEFLSVFGVGLTAVVAWLFISRLGKTIPIMELMLLIAGLQWIVGAVIEYKNPLNHFKYYMYVPEQEYMNYVVPAYGIFVIVILFRLKKAPWLQIDIESLKSFKKYGVQIFLLGVFFDLISGFLPGAIGFFAYLVGNFKFAGAIILFFSEDAKLKRLFYFSLVYLFLRALQGGMFHDLVLWSVFFFMFWALKRQPSKTQIVMTIAIGLFAVATLQTVKAAYRDKVWKGYGGNKLELFTDLFLEAVLSSGESNEDYDVEESNVRLNQGWIISAILDEIPRRVNYLKGETISDAILASIFPRFLNPNKKKAGGKENFEKFTGLELGEKTSMGISIVGEAYGNFGVFGGVLFMGLWGLVLVWYWDFLLKKSRYNLLLIAFLPLIFLQVVKAETELAVVLNHLVKASIVVFLFSGLQNVF
jgi:hypothetical protein